jgi:hypothetical protein
MDDTVLRHIAVQADYVDERRDERPVDIGLGHCSSWAIARIHGMRPWGGRAEVPHERIERLLGGQGISVVVSGYREDRGKIMLIRLIELPIILGCLPIEVDAITESIEKRWIDARIGRTGKEILLQPLRHPLLWHGKFDAAQIAVGMEDEAPPGADCRV